MFSYWIAYCVINFSILRILSKEKINVDKLAANSHIQKVEQSNIDSYNCMLLTLPLENLITTFFKWKKTYSQIRKQGQPHLMALQMHRSLNPESRWTLV